MSKHLPPKPEMHFISKMISDHIASPVNIYGISKEDFDLWYAEHIEPLFKDAVEVTGEASLGWWSVAVDKNKFPASTIGKTHKALLINIQPIKEETAEDLLREFVEVTSKAKITECDWGLYCRAKAFLEKK